MLAGARGLLGTGCLLIAAAWAGEAEACSPAEPPDHWERSFSGNKRLVYVGRSDSGPTQALRFYDGKTLKWMLPWTGRDRTRNGDPFELSPNGKVLAIFGSSDLRLLSAKDGSTIASVALTDTLNEAERFGGSTELPPGRFRAIRPCGEGRSSSERWSQTHQWKKNGVLRVTVTTPPQIDGARRQIELEVEAGGQLARLTPQAAIELEPERVRYTTATTEEDRRKALTTLVWASSQQASLEDKRTEPFFLAVARDLEAPPDFLRLAITGALRRGFSERKDLFEFVGRDAAVDEILLERSGDWTVDQQRNALTVVLSAKQRSGEQLMLAFTLLTSKLSELGEIAAKASQSTEPALRSALLAKLSQLPPSPSHLSAALTFLNERDEQSLEVARKVTLENLNRAALKRHTEEILEALSKQKIKPWAAGDLAFGIYLQASGQVALAGGLFASGVERTEEKPTELRNELLNRLALNMLMRGKLIEARAAIQSLEISGGPLGGPLICALTVPDVRVGLMSPCPRRVPTKVQAEALLRTLPQTQ